VRIAFLGPWATFCEQALRSLPEAAGAELVPCNGSPAVLAAVRDGSVHAGCVPIENTTEGAVPAVLDGLVLDPPLMIVREVQIPVRFAVLVRPGTTRDDIATISSHPHGIAQVRDWIAEHLPKAEVYTSTSTSEATCAARSTRPSRRPSRPGSTAWRSSSTTSPTTPARSPASRGSPHPAAHRRRRAATAPRSSPRCTASRAR
jgi:prephenate dehydratase